MHEGMLWSIASLWPYMQSLDVSRAGDACGVKTLITTLETIDFGDCALNLEVVLTRQRKGQLCLAPLHEQPILKQQLQSLVQVSAE